MAGIVDNCLWIVNRFFDDLLIFFLILEFMLSKRDSQYYLWLSLISFIIFLVSCISVRLYRQWL